MNARLTTFAALAVALCATSASAATLSGVVTPVPGQPGKFEVNINLATDSGPQVVSFDLTFQGYGDVTVINQLGFAQPQTRGSVANIPDQFDPNYKKATDSWLDDELQPDGSRLGFVVINPSEGPNLLKGGLATDVTIAPPQSFTSGRIAHLYIDVASCNGGLLITGSVAVGSGAAQAFNFPFPFIICPEPAALPLSTLGLVAFAACRRRQARCPAC